MSAEQSPKTTPADTYQSAWYRLLVGTFAIYLTAFWFVLGPSNPAYAVSVALGTFSLGPAIAGPLARRVPRQWLRVPAVEHVLHRILGVGVFGWLLDVTGWNRHVAEPMRGFTGTRSGLFALEYGVRAGLCAHGGCFALHALLSVLALFAEYPWRGAFWMLAPAVMFHFYPALLQRSLLRRLQPLLDKVDAR